MRQITGTADYFYPKSSSLLLEVTGLDNHSTEGLDGRFKGVSTALFQPFRQQELGQISNTTRRAADVG